jgi:hypothetical protein
LAQIARLILHAILASPLSLIYKSAMTISAPTTPMLGLAPSFTPPDLRLATLIKEAFANGNNPHRLAAEINQSNAEVHSPYRVNHKTLAKLRDNPEAVGLTYAMLVALNTHFKKFGKGLQQLPIFETRGILEVLTETPRLFFMIGAKPRPEERRTDISRWDARSLAELQTHTSMLGMRHEQVIEDVLWRSPVNPEAAKSEDWYHILEEDQHSVVSIGSPLAALSSEEMLARMFKFTPFVKPPIGRQVPFLFVWVPKKAKNFRSAFGLTWSELATLDKDVAKRVQANKADAFVLDSTVYEVPSDGDSWTMHGIIAAQRRANGNVWLVISGLAGPATYAAATMVKEIDAELPWSRNRISQVLWLPVKVKIGAGAAKSISGDIREIEKVEFDGPPRLWPESHS